MTISSDSENAIFGSFDGLTTSIGVAAALTLSHHPSASIIVAILAASLAAAIGMGAGKWLSDSDDGFRESAVMFVATAAGGFLPAIPFLLTTPPTAFIISLGLASASGGAIGYLRRRHIRGYIETFGILAIVVAVTIAVGLIAPSA